MRLAGLLALLGLIFILLGAANEPAWRWSLPQYVSAPIVPAGNPMSAAKVALGRRLFYDADLSINGTMSCASCHGQRGAFSDRARTHAGAHSEPGRRNVPSLTNIAWMSPLTWADPRLTTLEQQILIPVLGTDPVEMGMAGQQSLIAERLGTDECYRQMFKDAFPEEKGKIALDTVAKALAAFERTFIAFDTPYDRALQGRAKLPAAAERGAALFTGAAGCSSCHAGSNFSDGRYHAVSTRATPDDGLATITGLASDRGKFRTPGLRNVALTAPYLHDGGTETLAKAIDQHKSAGALSPAARDDLVAFLNSLTDSGFVTNPDFTIPKAYCGKPR